MVKRAGQSEALALHILAVIPSDLFEKALISAKRGTRGFAEAEGAQWRLVMSAIRV